MPRFGGAFSFGVIHARAVVACGSLVQSNIRVRWMKKTVAGLVTPHLLRIVELADSAQKGAKVEWHVRDAVARTMGELGGQANASELVAAYLEGLDNAAVQVPDHRMEFARVLKAAADAARRLRRD
jgi:hypothetical protein